MAEQSLLQLIKVLSDSLKPAGIPPAAPLLMNCWPGRQVVEWRQGQPVWAG